MIVFTRTILYPHWALEIKVPSGGGAGELAPSEFPALEKEGLLAKGWLSVICWGEKCNIINSPGRGWSGARLSMRLDYSQYDGSIYLVETAGCRKGLCEVWLTDWLRN